MCNMTFGIIRLRTKGDQKAFYWVAREFFPPGKMQSTRHRAVGSIWDGGVPGEGQGVHAPLSGTQLSPRSLGHRSHSYEMRRGSHGHPLGLASQVTCASGRPALPRPPEPSRGTTVALLPVSPPFSRPIRTPGRPRSPSPPPPTPSLQCPPPQTSACSEPPPARSLQGRLSTSACKASPAGPCALAPFVQCPSPHHPSCSWKVEGSHGYVLTPFSLPPHPLPHPPATCPPALDLVGTSVHQALAMRKSCPWRGAPAPAS